MDWYTIYIDNIKKNKRNKQTNKLPIELSLYIVNGFSTMTLPPGSVCVCVSVCVCLLCLRVCGSNVHTLHMCTSNCCDREKLCDSTTDELISCHTRTRRRLDLLPNVLLLLMVPFSAWGCGCQFSDPVRRHHLR